MGNRGKNTGNGLWGKEDRIWRRSYEMWQQWSVRKGGVANGAQCAEIWVEKSCEQTRVRRTDSREVGQWHVRDGYETIQKEVWRVA